MYRCSKSEPACSAIEYGLIASLKPMANALKADFSSVSANLT